MILALQKHGRSLFLQGVNAHRQIVQETEAVDGGIDDRVRKALPMARDLLQETIEGLRHLSRMAPVEHADGIASSQVQVLDQIDWPRLLGRSKELNNPLAQRAIEDFNSALNSSLISSPASIDEICSALDRICRDVSDLIDAQPDEASAVTIIQIVWAATRLAIAVAVGLLAAAASTASAGGDVASSLIPAAVGVVVTGLCDRLGKALKTISQMPQAGEILKTDHDELVFMLQDLAAFIDPRKCRTRHQGENLDVELVGDTAAVAEVTAQHAQILAKKVNWPPAHIYSTQLSDVRKLVIEAGNISHDSDSERIHLAKRFQSMAAELAGWKIPDSLREISTISHPVPIPDPAELDQSSAVEAPTTVTVPGPDACSTASGLRGLDARPGKPNTLPDSAAAPPLSVTTPTAVVREQAEAKRQTLPTRTSGLNDDSMNPITWVASGASLDDSADQPQSPTAASAEESRKVRDILNNPYLGTGTDEATDLGRAIDGLSTLD